MAVGKAVKEIIERELAQRAKAGDGLAMDYASRMARAKEMGFDTSKTYYHGTTREFDSFEPTESLRQGFMGAEIKVKSPATFMTENKRTAGVFADNRAEFMGGNPRICASDSLLSFHCTRHISYNTLASFGFIPYEGKGSPRYSRKS